MASQKPGEPNRKKNSIAPALKGRNRSPRGEAPGFQSILMLWGEARAFKKYINALG